MQSEEGILKQLTILGSTGSIGTQALDIVRLFPDRLRVRALTAWRNVSLLAKQAREFRPDCVVVGDSTLRDELTRVLEGEPVRVLAGADALQEAAALPEVDTVLAAMVGFAGLRPVLTGIREGKTIALANKETLVAGGALVKETMRRHDNTMIPVDSEHSAIFQCLVGEPARSIESLVLTASGGPFRNRAVDTFASISRDEALRHPNWSMGAKITIDSATMMNKGLEVIEARWLFNVPASKIDVLVHPQSIIHSMVAFDDGSTKAQLGVPDMRVPIQYALTYPDRWPAPHPRLDWKDVKKLDFETPDDERFPCLRLAFEALERGGTAPAVLNAANEAAVALFLREEIRFVDIPRIIEKAVVQYADATYPSLEVLVEVSEEVIRQVQELYGAPAN